MRSSRLSRRPDAGFTLIEVLVAVIILGIGLLGMARLQLVSLRNNNGAYLRSQATMLATDLLDRMRINRQTAVDGDYLVADPSACSTAACADLSAWQDELEQALGPGSDFTLTCQAVAGAAACANEVTVTLTWLDPSVQVDPESTADPIASLSITSRL